jgi:hypothetical protein
VPCSASDRFCCLKSALSRIPFGSRSNPGALSPADDVLDVAVAAVLVRLLGWHWEFLPAFAAELVPGVDWVPFWTLAVLNVYRKWKQITITTAETREQRPALKGQQNSL